MNEFSQWLFFLISLGLLPLLVLGSIRKIKARLQGRKGPPILQVLFGLIRLIKKDETVSRDRSWLFDATPALILATVLLLSLYVPWLSYKPLIPGDDLFLVVYLLAFIRFFSILSAMDCGSPLSGFAASREATLAILVEPAIVLSLLSLAIMKTSTNLAVIFSFNATSRYLDMAIWALAAGCLFIASLVELSRMPIDDPTTHLELTMVHEAMVIENSGRNLAMTEFAYALRLVILFGLVSQCIIHCLNAYWPIPAHLLNGLSVAGIFLLAISTAVVETACVKLKWTQTPEFIAYAVSLSLLGCLAVLLRGSL